MLVSGFGGAEAGQRHRRAVRQRLPMVDVVAAAAAAAVVVHTPAKAEHRVGLFVFHSWPQQSRGKTCSDYSDHSSFKQRSHRTPEAEKTLQRAAEPSPLTPAERGDRYDRNDEEKPFGTALSNFPPEVSASIAFKVPRRSC